MKWPKLVRVAKTPVKVNIVSEEMNEFGDDTTLFVADLMCNFQEQQKRVMDGKEMVLKYIGIALFDGDFIPDHDFIGAGSIIVNGVVRKIINGSKCRNPDGTVNYIKFEVE